LGEVIEQRGPLHAELGGELLGRDAEALALEHQGGSAGEVEPLSGSEGRAMFDESSNNIS
jgi:hypothetical protein